MTPFKRQSWLGLLGLAAVSLMQVGDMQAAAPVEKVVLQLPYTHQFQFAGLYAAQARGYFREAGLEVELRTGDSRRRPVDEVLKGHAQYGISGNSLLLNRLNGRPLIAVAVIFQHSPFVIITRQGIGTPADLVGRRIASESAAQFPELPAMFWAEGIRPDQFEVVPQRWDALTMVDSGVDAMVGFSTNTPYDLEREGVKLHVIKPADYGVDFYGDTLFCSEEEARRHPGRVIALRRALQRGWEYAIEHQPEMIDWILRELPDRPGRVTRERLQFEAAETVRLVNANLVEIGHMNPGRWRRMAETLVQLGLARDLERLDGFQFHEPAEQWKEFGLWLGGGLALATLAVLGTLLANRRLKRLVERRTGELQASERRYRELFDLAPVALMERDFSPVEAWFAQRRAEGITDLRRYLAEHPERQTELLMLPGERDFNAAALKLAGANSKEELNASIPRQFIGQTAATQIEIFLAHWAGQGSCEGEIPLRMSDGTTRVVHYTWCLANRPRGSVRRSLTALVDVTAQHEAARAVSESEERYRRLFETTPNPMYIYDRETLRFLIVNESMVERYGYSRAELMNMSVFDIRPADEVGRLQESMRKLQREGAVVPETYAAGLWRHRRKDGSLMLVEVFTHTLTLKGRPCVLVLPFDVTAKLAAEQALRESEARYRELFENAVGGVYRSMADGRFISANPAFAGMLGFETADGLIAWSGQNSTAQLYVRPGRREEFLRQIKAQDRIANFESEVRRRDGSTIWVAENVRVVRDADGQIRHFEGFVSDITARRRLEEEMMRATKLDAVGILAGGIAHDFNNILTVILGNITMAEMDLPADSAQRHLLRDAQQATLHARDLTQQLLTFAKGGDPVREAIELPELLRESAGFALHGAKARAEFALAADLRAVEADKGQLGQVIQNLVINSVQAMPQGGIVRLEAANETLRAGGPGGLPAGDYVRISVSDTGVGIMPEHLGKIFDPYFTTKQQGSGLGLATVYSIVKKHQGHIEVASQLGQGSVFRLWLPVASEIAAHRTEPSATGMRLHARVLFMDDEEPIRRMARTLMERMDLECELAADGTEAVRIYRDAQAAGRPFDIVLMDLTVPGGMGGREAIELLRGIDPKVKAIVSSGYSQDPVMANYRKHGFHGILPKPYDLKQLRQVLVDALGIRQQPKGGG